jgi:two-component system, OmpR family, response regulator BaeR
VSTSAAGLAADPGPARVLVVEDEPRLAALLADYLRAAGHEPECVADGAVALQAYAARRHDLVLLDLMLPGLDGLAVCRRLRETSAVPIVMLTARADEADRLAGLELGADDYIAKNPFSPREVVARLNAVLRRTRAPALPAAALHIDEAAWTAHWQGRPLDLTPNEFRLLRTLASRPGRVFERAQLLEQLHADGRAPVRADADRATDRAVDSHVKNLRRKLELAGAGNERIRAVYGVGYCYDG